MPGLGQSHGRLWLALGSWTFDGLAEGNSRDRRPHTGLRWTRDRSWDANRCWIWNWPRAIDLQWQPPLARRGVSSGVVVHLSIRNLQVVWRATVVRCIAKAAEG